MVVVVGVVVVVVVVVVVIFFFVCVALFCHASRNVSFQLSTEPSGNYELINCMCLCLCDTGTTCLVIT